MKNMIAPSMISVDYSRLKETLAAFEKSGIDYLHIDVMDGEFVPNIALGTDYCKAVRKMCSIPHDIHFMVVNPEKKINYFEIKEGDIVSVHYESTSGLTELLSSVKEKGAKAMVVLRPETPVSVLEKFVHQIDGVLIMTVHPGYPGQKFIDYCADKVAEAKKLFTGMGYTDKIIEVDGNIGFENSKTLKTLGANMFVGGTASIFFKGDSLENNIANMIKVLE